MPFQAIRLPSPIRFVSRLHTKIILKKCIKSQNIQQRKINLEDVFLKFPWCQQFCCSTSVKSYRFLLHVALTYEKLYGSTTA